MKTRIAWVLVLSLSSLSCSHPSRNPAGLQEVREKPEWYRDEVATQTSGTWRPQGLKPENAEWIDIRGVGDSAWASGGAPQFGQKKAMISGFGRALAAVDPDQTLFRGDFSFINWESVVGVECQSIRRSVDFYFLSHPENIEQAFAHGFNLFSFANNHAQDCNLGKGGADSSLKSGPLMTAEQLEQISDRRADLAWHGVGSRVETPGVSEFTVNGKRVRVALAAIAILGWSIPNSASIDFNHEQDAISRARKIFKGVADSGGDLRVLSIHTQDASGNGRPEAGAFLLLKKLAEIFIKEYGGHIVFGEGPHTWGGVKIVTDRGGRKGVVFTSMGNFIHPGLGGGRDNYVARALFDPSNFSVREVQVVPFMNRGTTVEFYDSNAHLKDVNSNFDWVSMRQPLNGQKVPGWAARFTQ